MRLSVTQGDAALARRPSPQPESTLERHCERQGGSILVAVLMLAGLIAALASAAAEMQRATYAAGLAYADGLRAETAMRSAIERTVAHGGDRTLQLRGGVVHLEQAIVTLEIRDEASRVDLNFAPRELLAGLFQAIGLDEAVADAHAGLILARRNPTTSNRPGEPNQPNPKRGGADGVAYPSNPFLHPAQIADIPEISRATAIAVTPFLTVASTRSSINPLVADLPVLLAVPGVSHDAATAFMRARREQPDLVEQFVGGIKNGTTYMAIAPGAAARFHAKVRIGGRTEKTFEAVVAVIAADSVPFRMLSWEATSSR